MRSSIDDEGMHSLHSLQDFRRNECHKGADQKLILKGVKKGSFYGWHECVLADRYASKFVRLSLRSDAAKWKRCSDIASY